MNKTILFFIFIILTLFTMYLCSNENNPSTYYTTTTTMTSSTIFSNGKWHVTPTPDIGYKYYLYDIDMVNTNFGRAGGLVTIGDINDGILLKYENGTWQVEKIFDNTCEISWIKQLSENTGWLGLNIPFNAEIYSYTDSDWQLMASPISCITLGGTSNETWIYGGCVLDENCIWICGMDDCAHKAAIFQYNDIDDVWYKHILPLEDGSGTVATDIIMLNNDEGWAVGYDSTIGEYEAIILHYINNKWVKEVLPTGDDLLELYSVSALDQNNVFVIGEKYNPSTGNSVGLILNYKDGNWNVIYPDFDMEDWGFCGISMYNNDNGWIAGYGINNGGGHSIGLLAYYDGEGDTWKLDDTIPSGKINIATDKNGGFLDVQALSPNDVWVTGHDGYKGLILHYY